MAHKGFDRLRQGLPEGSSMKLRTILKWFLFGVSESNPLMDDMQNCVILAKPNYLHKDGKISSACYKIVGEQKIYFTHKDNLYSR